MAKRQSVLGLPIGPRKRRPPIGKAVAGVGLAALPAAVPVARRIAQGVSSGRQKVHQASDVAETASHIKDAVSEQSSTLGKAGAVVSELRKIGGGADGMKMSHLIEEYTDVAIPRTTLYNQWTQFEMFPSITKGAESASQEDRDRVKWTSKIGPSRRSWEAEITHQVPDELIAFRGKGGLDLTGVVSFHSLDRDLTRVIVDIRYKPRGFVEHVGNTMRVQRRRVRRDLRLYKHFVELRNEETGAWRGRIAKKKDADRESGSAGHANRKAS